MKTRLENIPDDERNRVSTCTRFCRHADSAYDQGISVWTGLRTSEQIALDWRDIDWIRCEAHIRRAQTMAARKTGPETTKTKAGTRVIKLLPPAMEALKRQKEWTFLKGQEVFQNPRTLDR